MGKLAYIDNKNLTVERNIGWGSVQFWLPNPDGVFFCELWGNEDFSVLCNRYIGCPTTQEKEMETSFALWVSAD